MSWLRKLGRATHLWGSGNSALSYLSGNVDYRRNRDAANSAYQRAAEDKRRAGINPLFDGGSVSPIPQSNTESGSGRIATEVLGTSLGLLNSALSAVNTFANADYARAGVVERGAHSAFLEEQSKDISSTRSARIGEMVSRIELTGAQKDMVVRQFGEVDAKINSLDADTRQKNALTSEVYKRLEKLSYEVSSAKSQADKDRVIAEFQTGIGGDIDRWTSAIGLKGRDLTQLVSILGVLGKFFGSSKKPPFGFDTGGR